MTIPAALSIAMDGLFAGHPLAGHAEIAGLLQMSTATLRRLGNDRKIVYRLKGTAWRFYAREDVEQYLRGMQCQSISPGEKTERSKARTGNSISCARSMVNIVDFSAALMKERRKRLKRSRPGKKLVLVPKNHSTR